MECLQLSAARFYPLIQVLEPSFRQAYGNVNRWFLTCINQPQFKAVLGEVKLCEKMAQFDGKGVGAAAAAWWALPSLVLCLKLDEMHEHVPTVYRIG